MTELKPLAIEAPTGALGSLRSFLYRLSGIPVFTSEEVQECFREAAASKTKAAVVPQAIAEGLADQITQMGAYWFVYKTEPESPLFTKRTKRIGKAISILEKELPGWLEEYNKPQYVEFRKVSPKSFPRHEEKLGLVSTLRETIGLIVHEGILTPTTGRPPEPWHSMALFLGPQILVAMEASGAKRAGFSNATSPAIAILKSALGWIGIAVDNEAIVKAMKQPKKGNKSV